MQTADHHASDDAMQHRGKREETLLVMSESSHELDSLPDWGEWHEVIFIFFSLKRMKI
jgi:hypothetical protein